MVIPIIPTAFVRPVVILDADVPVCRVFVLTESVKHIPQGNNNGETEQEKENENDEQEGRVGEDRGHD
jgi:hypothetical protein